MPFLGFRVIREDWGHYKLSNGLEVRARLLLLRLFDDGKGPIKMTTGPQIDVWAPPEMMGAPAGVGTNAAASKVLQTFKEGDWETVSQAHSIYDVDGGSNVTLKFFPVRMMLHEAFGANGEPVVTVESTQEITVMGERPGPAKHSPKQAT